MPMLTGKRAERTRRSMLDAGLELLVDRPIDAIPIDDVIARAGVAKGSFFNHFVDKEGFAGAVYEEIRSRLEKRIGEANSDVEDPVMRLAGGMRVAVEFALQERKSAIAMLRTSSGTTSQSHPLNSGVRMDVRAAIEAGLIGQAAEKAGVLYWLGLCQIMMASVIERQPDAQKASDQLHDMLKLGLAGLGATQELTGRISAESAAMLNRGDS